MPIEIKTPSYNHRRYSRPWIAIVDFADPRGHFRWGTCIQDAPGEEGLLVIDARPGDIIASGQKDYRGNNGGTDWYIILPDGSRGGLENRAAAYKAWRVVRKFEEVANA